MEVKTIQYDFADPDNYGKIGEQLKDLEIGVLGKILDNLFKLYFHHNYNKSYHIIILPKVVTISAKDTIYTVMLVLKKFFYKSFNKFSFSYKHDCKFYTWAILGRL